MKKHNQRGFTLIEMIVVVGVLSIFSIFMVNIIMSSQNAMAVQNATVPVRAEARQILESIAKELRAADPTAPGGISIGGSGNNQTITFRTPNQVSGANVISWNKVEFSRDTTSKEIRRQLNDGTITVAGHDSLSLQFTNPSADVYKITIQNQKTLSGGTDTVSATLSSEVKVRN